MTMSKISLVVEGVSDEPDFPLTALANMMGEAARRLDFLEENMAFPITMQVKREHGWLKLSAAKHPEHEEALNTARRPPSSDLAVGFYVPTPEFLAITEHTAVMDAVTQELVATTGPAGDRESQADARLFAASRIMRDALQAVSEQLAAWSLNGGVLSYTSGAFYELNQLELIIENALVTATGEW